ncbi:MAG: DMT family transporter [Pseudolabrys sp.]|nr:DMT family transporter [Pseudolabrys sp.]
MQLTLSNQKLGYALGFLGVLMFGATLPATKLAIPAMDPWFVTGMRASIAGISALVLLLILRRPLPPRELWLPLFLTGLCTIIGFPLFMSLAAVTVPAAHGGVVLGILPIATVVVATFVTDERPSLGFWLASIAGASIVIYFVLSNGDAQSAHGISPGDLYLLGTVVAGGFAYAMSGKLSKLMPGWEVISWQVVGYLPLALLTAFWNWPSNLADVPASAWGGLAYIGFISQFFAFFVFNAAMALGGVSKIGQFIMLQPFIVVALAAPVNGEPIRGSTLFYAVLVVATVIVGQYMRVSHKK